jgi:arylsulfatase
MQRVLKFTKHCLWLLCSLIPALHAQSTESPQPNIVLLYADDWRHDTLGCAGHPVVQTPNLDALAKDGVRFTRACVTTSICGVSRATLLTGQWMSRHGNRAFGPFQTPWADTFPGRLRANGYWVGHVGKWHNGPFPKDRYDFSRAYDGRHYVTNADGSRTHVTRKNEADALEFLQQRPPRQPFSLTVAFFAPHAEDGDPKQYLYQPESEPLYRDAAIPLPLTGDDDHFRRLPPFLANEQNEGRRRWRIRFDTPDMYQNSMKAYYRLVSEVDAACGSILAELRRQQLLEQTLVIFTTDNGYFHGEHGLADKWYPYEEAIRVPLILRDPRTPASRRGTSCDEFALNADLAPTILSAAGVEIPTGMQGRDLSPFVFGETPSDWRDEYFYEHAVIRNVDFIPSSAALVRKDWKYIVWPDFEREELFDLVHDPRETHDLSRDPNQAERLAEMRGRFAERKEQAK